MKRNIVKNFPAGIGSEFSTLANDNTPNEKDSCSATRSLTHALSFSLSLLRSLTLLRCAAKREERESVDAAAANEERRKRQRVMKTSNNKNRKSKSKTTTTIS